jgi:phage shock protein A
MVRFSVAASALLCLMASSTTSAFAPHRSVGSSTFVRSSAPAPFMPAVQHAYSRNSVSMNLFDRFTRVAKSNINNVLKNLEDPEKIMNQALEDMQVR